MGSENKPPEDVLGESSESELASGDRADADPGSDSGAIPVPVDDSGAIAMPVDDSGAIAMPVDDSGAIPLPVDDDEDIDFDDLEPVAPMLGSDQAPSDSDHGQPPAPEAALAAPPPPDSADAVPVEIPQPAAPEPTVDAGEVPIDIQEAPVDTGEVPIDIQEAPVDTGELSAAGDDIEVIEDFDEIEMVEEGVSEAAQPPPTPPSSSPPPPPVRAAPPPTPSEAPPAQDDDQPEVPIEQQIESPTVVDLFLKEVEEGSWEPRAEKLARDLESATDKGQVALLAYELGELYQRRLADEARAVKAYGRALQADPSFRPNLWAIRRVFYGRGLWPNLIKLLDAEIRFARNDAERADLHVEKGDVLADHLDKVDEARAAYEKAVALAPETVSALLSLERLALSANDEATLERVWRHLAAAAASPGRKLGYLLDLSRLYRARGGIEDLDQARAVMAEAVALGAEAGGAEQIARERERLAELADDPVELLGVLEARIARLLSHYGPAGPQSAPGESRAPGSELDRETALRLQIVALRRRQARIARTGCNDAERAWNYLEQALALAGGEPLVLADLADVAEQLGKFAELAELCQGWESLEGDPARSLSLAIRRADALLRGGQREQASALLDSLAASAPGYLPITALRERDALAEGDWASLAATQIASAEAALLGTSFGPGVERPPDRSGAAAELVAAGDLMAFYLGQHDEAANCYGRALEAVPGYPPAVEALAMLHEQTGKLAEATELLELHSEVGSPEYQHEVLERLARLYSDLGRYADLVTTLGRLLILDPDSVRLRWRLDDVLAAQGDAEPRVANLSALAERIDDPAQRAAVLSDAARICEGELDAADRAIELYRKVLEIWPNDRYSRVALIALLRRAERWDDLVAERKSEAAQLEDGPALVRALREAAALLVHPLDRPADAADLYRELCDRVPGDLFAMRELCDALEAAGDLDGLADALSALADAQQEPQARAATLLRLGTVLERLDRSADALDVYRRATETDPESPFGGFAMAELAVGSNDTSTLVEAFTAIAERSPDGTVRSELLEEVGWLWTLILQDYDRGAEAFAEATAADPNRRGPLLGLAMTHAKREAPADAGDALVALAATVHAPYAASSMLLRAAAIAEVAGDPEIAQQRIAKAAVIAPADPGSLLVASEYLPAGAGDDLPADEAIEQLLRRANLFGLRAELATDAAARHAWALDRADALEGAGRLREAGEIVAGVLKTRPDDVRALQTLRRLCQRGGDRNSLARASLALGLIIGDREGTLELLREAAEIFDGEQSDSERAVLVYRRILAADPGAPEFDRLNEILAAHDDDGGLIELIDDRLNYLSQTVADDPDSAATIRRAPVPLLHQRARLRRKLGDVAGAERDLSRLLEIDENHTEALFGRAELLARAGDAAAAAELFRRFLDLEMDPERRAVAELQLSQILAEDMSDLDGAIEQLEHVIEQAPDDLEVRERLIGLLTKNKSWDRVVREIRELERLRPRPADRANDELRIGAIFRDRLEQRDKAQTALERARQIDPLNIDAVRELSELTRDDPAERERVLHHAAADLRGAIVEAPARTSLYERLARVAEWLGADEARFFALGGLGGVGALSAEQKPFVEKLQAAAAAAGLGELKMLGADDWRARLADPRSGGFAAELWQVVAEAAAKGTGLDAGQLGFARNHKVATKQVGRSFPALAGVLHAFAVTDLELYVSDTKAGYARVVNGAKPTLFLSADVARADNAVARFFLGRAVAQVHDGTGTLAELRDDELLLLFAAAAQVAGVTPAPAALVEITSGNANQVAERSRQLSKQLGRRDRKNLALISSRFSQLVDPLAWRRAALSTSWRAGLLIGGDIEAALDALDVGRGGRSVLDNREALDLLAWAVGDDHLTLRGQLGLAKGA